MVNPDLQRERDNATFTVEKITNMFDGSKAKTERRRYIEKVFENDPSDVFDNSNNHYLHRTDRHVRAIAKHVRMVEVCRKLGIGDECGGMITDSEDFFTVLDSISDDLPTAIHWVMFVPNIVNLCDEEQKAEWLPMCRDWKMIGCYAQTEMGHGSNVRALETTATFVPESKGGMKGGSFVINSPTLTSGKFWPGTLGRTATYAMVIARLIDGDGVDQGIQNFLVPIRSMTDHTLLPGVKAGDIGPKVGFNNMDNGFAYFDNVEIPRRNMAMKFAEVDEAGKFLPRHISDASSKVAYITMMQVRALIVQGAWKTLSTGVAITIRYSAVRKQGYGDDGKTELQVLDYTQQQHRIFPLLAASYAFFFNGRKLWENLKSIEGKLMNNTPISKVAVADIHAASSALKAFATMVSADGVEECRRACGGHGFLAASGLPELATTNLQGPTVEGENGMLPQQVIKVLLKLVQAVKTNKGVEDYKGCYSYGLVPSLQAILRGEKEQCKAVNAKDMKDIPTLLHAFRHRAARLLLAVAKNANDIQKKGGSTAEAFNKGQVGFAKFSKAYALFLFLQDFVQGILEEQRGALVGRNEVAALTDLAKLFGVYWMDKDIGEFLQDGYISSQQADWLAPTLIECLDTVRPNAVALVDARDISDFRLKSVLGRNDGDVYPAIMESALKDPLNATDPSPAYDPELKRLIAGGVGVYTGTASRL